MSTSIPNMSQQGMQRTEARGGNRTEANAALVQEGTGGKDLPAGGKTNVSATQEAAHRSELTEAVAQLNDYIQTVQRDLRFDVDESSGESIIFVVDRESSEVVRRIPAEVTISLARKLSNEEPVLLFSAQV